jgi:succinyl-CoA--D-citramalate CoA-transferase
MSSELQGPLQGYRVLELCSTIAGPACTRMMADFGAEVIKIEPPQGDPVRKFGVPDQGVELCAAAILRNKQTVTIDLKSDQGVELVRALAARCDIVVENFRPRTLERLGLGYEQLSADNPGLVLVRISGYGQSGPYSQKAGYGAICEAFGGIRELIGEPGKPPVRVAVPVTDYLAATYAAFGAVTALLHRERTGQGQVVDTALYEAAFSMMEGNVPSYDRFHVAPVREGSRLPYMAPNNLYLTADDTYLLIAANNDAVFARLATAINKPELVDDPRFATIAVRWKNVDAIDAEIGEWVGAHSGADAQAMLDEAGVPASLVYTLHEIFQDPHYREREMLLDVPHPVFGTLAQPGIVPKLSATPGAVRWHGRKQGENTREVLGAQLGLDEAALDQLEAAGVISSGSEQ